MEDNKNTTQGAVTPTTSTNEDNKGGKKTFSQEEVNAIISERLNEQKTKNDELIKNAVANTLAEQERQAKLTEAEREKEAKSKREQELKEREDNIALRERKLEAQELLKEKNIPIELADFVINLDEKVTKDNIEKLSKTYNKSVEAGVTDKLKGTPPTDFSNENNNNTDKSKKIMSAF